MGSSYSQLVPLAFAAFFPVTLGIFMVLAPRRAAIAAFLVGWLFLPMVEMRVTGLPDISKSLVTNLSVLTGVCLFDSQRVRTLHLQWTDLAMLVFCLCRIPSALSNGTGMYDGSAQALDTLIRWGIPYFVGRIYFVDRNGLRDLAVGVVIGGLVYIPLCLYEIRMSPQLHNMVYGVHQHSFAQQKRWGGFRPMVFMHHGQMVALWMAFASLCALGLWRFGVVRRIRGVPMSVLFLGLAATLVLCKTVGALILFATGVVAIVSVEVLRSHVFILALAAVPALYVGLRASGVWSGDILVQTALPIVGVQRAQSLETRIVNESRLAERARERPLFGWGAWGASRVLNERGKDISTVDGLWIVILGRSGFTGLVSFLLLEVGAMYPLRRKFRSRIRTALAPATVVAVCVVVWFIYNLPNYSHNPLLLLMLGGLVGLGGTRPRRLTAAGTPAAAENR